MALQQWALPELSKLIPLDQESLEEIINYSASLPEDQANEHLRQVLGDSPEALDFIIAFNEHRSAMPDAKSELLFNDTKEFNDTKDSNAMDQSKEKRESAYSQQKSGFTQPPQYAPPAYAPPPQAPQARSNAAGRRPHTNAVIEAGKIRARDEQQMQQMLQNVQYQYGIYNSDIEPEHEADWCNCAIHRYKWAKYSRLGVQDMWSRAVMYPGEKAYHDCYQVTSGIFTNNPYRYRVISPYGWMNQGTWGVQRPSPGYHAKSIHQTIQMNNNLNREGQANIDAKEPKVNIWNDAEDELSTQLSNIGISDEKRQSISAPSGDRNGQGPAKSSKLSSFRKSMGIKSTEERAVAKTEKAVGKGHELRNTILAEEQGRWPDGNWQQLVSAYQEKVGMARFIGELRTRKPIQYLHLLRAGYFEPIPVAWAGSASNPLKFSIEAASGWRGITPAWRGYEDTAEERLYWVLNHREGSVGMRMKPDFISEMNMARDRMAKAVEPPPEYYTATDTCNVQHMGHGYSKQVMPAPFQPFDRPEDPTDDTMILLDVSGSMDFEPQRPNYDQYLIKGFSRSNQPKNKDVAKAIVRRFSDCMSMHDHAFGGYDLTTFSSYADYIGSVNHQNLDHMWRKIRFGGGTRVMTGWQKVKDLHFQKHSESAIHHPVYGWQAGPETPMLRLLLLLDGEATDMDEFELDLLGLSWAHVTIFLIGVDGCPHHHRHANELQRISDVNHHVSFVDAQGNFPERFVTHELLKRHLGYEVSIQEFESMEELPPYTA